MWGGGREKWMKEREIQTVGDRKKHIYAAEEMIVDIQVGQRWYAGHLLLQKQKVDSTTKHMSSGPKTV